MLILAGVSIATLTGENGILTQADKSKQQTEIAEVKERAKLDIMDWQAEQLKNRQNDTLTDSIIKSILTGKNYVGSAGDSSFTTATSGYEIAYSDLYQTTTGGGTGSLPFTDDTTPFLPTGATVINDDLATGVVIKDSKQNEWVWIEVPKSKMPTGLTFENDTDYTTLETALQTYASVYRKSNYEDTWYSSDQHGFASSDDYNDYKNNMLKSVYENGGFYIGRYEVGVETPRTAKTDDTGLTTPIIQRDSYPYNYVTCKQAQTLSNQLATGGKTSSLMFGIQWDLVMKFIEEKGKLADGTKVTQNMLTTYCGSWGNYYDVTFDITRGQYTTYNSNTSTLNPWTAVTSSYKKPASSVLLTTGGTDRNSTLNIYDLAGNEWEWTLERYTANTNNPWSVRGGGYSYSGNSYPVSYRFSNSFFVANSEISGFRPALY